MSVPIKMKITKAQIKQILKEELEKARQLKEDTKASDEPYVDPFSPEQRKAMKAHTARAKELGPLKYGDDDDSPTLHTQMQDAILAAAEALDAGNLELARAAFPESLLKQLRPYDGPVGELPTKAQLDAMDDYDI